MEVIKSMRDNGAVGERALKVSDVILVYYTVLVLFERDTVIVRKLCLQPQKENVKVEKLPCTCDATSIESPKRILTRIAHIYKRQELRGN